ncbi:MAG: STY4528 family pathogenicity island replication protein, partial [bacterium]
TLARSLAILRICRWITLCRRVRDQRGRHRGNIYALHEEPLQLASTVYLDPSYMDFLHEAMQHHHGRVRNIARAMLESLERRLEEGEDVLADSPLSQTGQRLEALGTAVNRGPGNYFTFHHRSIAALHAWRRHRENTRSSPVQKLNSDRVQNLNSVLCSSSYLTKTTTTRGDREDAISVAEKTPAAELVFPETLSANERRLAPLYLKGLEATLQQGLLDELGEKLRRQAKTDHPVRNPIGLLAWMCQQARAGRPPLTSDHLHLQERRERERRINERIEAEQRRLTEMALQQASSRPAPRRQRAQGTNERGDQTR